MNPMYSLNYIYMTAMYRWHNYTCVTACYWLAFAGYPIG